MAKKKKRGQSSATRLIILITTIVLLLLLALITPLFMGMRSDTGFATETWYDPFFVCPTRWVPISQEFDNAEIRNALNETDFDVTRIVITSAATNCHDVRSPVYNMISIQQDSQDSNAAWLADNEQVGIRIRQILAAIRNTSISQAAGEVDVIRLDFFVDGNLRRSWTMNFVQALRAYDVGLTGLDLFEIGLVR